MDEQLNETKTTEEKGSVVLPTVIGGGAAFWAKHLYNKAADGLVAAAIKGDAAALKSNEKVAGKLIEESQKILSANDAALGDLHASAKVLSSEPDVATIERIEVSALKGKDAAGKELKGFLVKAHNSEASATLHVNKLSGEAGKLLKDGAVITDPAQIESLTKGGASSWLGKAAAESEKGVLKTIRGNKAWAEAGGGFIANVKHMGTGSKVLAGAAVVATVAGVGTGIKNLFGSHTSRVEAERTAPATGQAR